MYISVNNYTLSSVVLFSIDVDLFSVDPMSKRERKEGVVRPGGQGTAFYVPGGPPEFRIKDFTTGATLNTFRSGFEGYVWQDQGNPDHYIRCDFAPIVVVLTELVGLWTYRIFDPTYVIGDQTPEKELALIRAEAVINFRTPTSTTLEGEIEWSGGGLDLKEGKVRPGVGGEDVSFEINGFGRPNTDTAGWEYDYHGHLTRNWPNTNPEVQRPFLVGSVFRAKSHNGAPPRSLAGEVFSFIAVKRDPPFTWELPGVWTYRSFLNDPTPVYLTAPPTVQELILQEGAFKLEGNPPPKGSIEWLGAGGGGLFLDLNGTVQPGVGDEPSSFEIKGTGRPDTDTAGRERHYQGHLTRKWPNGIGQRLALVGSVFDPEAPGRSLPFIAVKRDTRWP